MRMKSFILTAAIFAGLCSTQAYAKTCKEPQYVPAKVVCDNNSSKSADFTTGCKFIAAHYEDVEVECPAQWVNVSSSDTTATQSQICSRAGLTSANIDGKTCASGEQRPTTGENASGIAYRYGKENGGTGGNIVTNYTIRGNTGGCSPNSSGSCMDYAYTYTYCYASGQKKDYDNSDRVVAFACD